jgi:signal transduction histidine kinase
VDVELKIAADLPPVSVDEGQIRQVLLNLLRNAREAMSAGGRVVLRAERDERGGVSLCVEDEGAGIDAEARERLFEPFYTTKTHGTGLGLVITQEIVEAHGGRILCEPREPRGTRFRVTLPGAEPVETVEVR